MRTPDDDPVCMARLLIWFYHQDIAFAADCPSGLPLAMKLKAEPELVESLTLPDEPDETLVYLLDTLYAMYEIADKYIVVTLRSSAVDRIQNLVTGNDEAFWSLRDYLVKSKIDCAPLKEIYNVARSARANQLRKDSRFPELREKEKEFWNDWFAEVADERDALADALTVTKSALDVTETSLEATEGKLDSEQLKTRQMRSRMSDLQKELDDYTCGSTSKRRRLTAEPSYTGQGRCGNCGGVGHPSSNCASG